MADQDSAPFGIEELVLADHAGLWAVRSTSDTVYYLDLTGEDRPVGNVLLLRAPGPTSPRGPWDGCWLNLVSVENTEGR